MKKRRITNAIDALKLRAPRRRTYHAAVCIAGMRVTIKLDAPNARLARQEAESITEDCGYLFTLIEV